MWRISALDRDGREIAHVELKMGELTIGRDSDRQLVLPSASVSRRHARIVLDGGSPCILDEGSSNGVLVDGVRISSPTVVGPTNRIEVAEFRITVESLLLSTEAVEPISSVTPPPSLPQGAPMRLVAEGGPYDGRMFDVREGQSHVGRAVDNDLVFDDPSLSRRHARLSRTGGQIQIEDLGSSNGTYVNGRKIGSGVVAAGDVVRFGDLAFRCEGGTHGSTRAVDPYNLPRVQLIALAGGGAVTVVLLLLAVVFVIRKVPPVQASGRDAIARVQRQADQHLSAAKHAYDQRKYADAKMEVEQALEADPANLEARRLRPLAAHGADDDRALTAGSAAVALGDRKGLETALRSLADITEGASQRGLLLGKLEPALVKFGNDSCGRRAWSDCAWALCRAYAVAPPGEAPSPSVARTLADAEKKLRRDRSYEPCKSVP